MNKTYSESHDYGNNAEIPAPDMSSDKDDLAAILDLPPVKSVEEDIMNDR